jgi:hypothetical protein
MEDIELSDSPEPTGEKTQTETNVYIEVVWMRINTLQIEEVLRIHPLGGFGKKRGPKNNTHLNRIHQANKALTQNRNYIV